MRGEWALDEPGADETFALTPLQKGLLAESLVAVDRGVDVEQIVWELDFVPETARFRTAWQKVVEDCDALRLGFIWPRTQSEPAQSVSEAVLLPFRRLELPSAEPGEDDARLERFLAQDRSDGFELRSAPLTRVSLLMLSPTRAVCVWTVHHSVIDGRSFALVLRRVLAHYDQRPSEAPGSFRDFLRWLAPRQQAAGVRHFASLLGGFSEPTPLPLHHGAVAARTGAGVRRARVVLGPAESARLRAAAAESSTSPNSLIQLGWGLLLANYSGRDDVVFGATWSGRHGTVEGAERIVGPCIGSLPIRVKLRTHATLRELASELREQHLALRGLVHTSLAEIKAASELAHGAQLFESLVVFERASLQTMLAQDDPRWRRQRVWSRSQAGYPLVLAARFDGPELELELELDAAIYDDAQAQRLLNDYARLLVELCADLERTPFAVPMLEPELLTALTTNEAARELAPPRRLPLTRILEQARARPNAVALAQIGGGELSYAELEQRVRSLAGALWQRGARPGVLVAVWLPRSIEAVIALLAVQLTGACYLPLEPQSPVDRSRDILQDARATLWLVDETTRGRVPGAGELELSALMSRDTAAFDAPLPQPDAAAYVIYTSGSTGKPKGVVVSQAALAQHVANTVELFALEPSDRVLQFTTLTFDVAMEEILPTLAAGATLVLRDEALAQSARGFFEAAAKSAVSVVNLPTAFWHQLVHAEHLQWPKCLRLVVVGGERVSAESHRRFREAGSSHVRWLNAYGPTEATITSTCYDDAEGDHGPEGVPIGRPLPGVSHFVLDERLRPVPPGSIGQLFIGGTGLALGYLYRDELTAKHFIAHPFRAGARLYATGDRVRQTSAGNYLFVDRPDNQVKLRGYRIELGEIEAQLRLHPAVSEAVVVLHHRGREPVLVGFVIADERVVSEAQLRQRLASALPAHMLPARLLIVTSLPTTGSGKVDRRSLAQLSLQAEEPRPALPVPEHSDPALPILLEIWSEVLGVTNADPYASFFDLGGNSLLVVRLFSEIELRLGKACNVAQFFRNPTLSHVSELLRDAKTLDRVGSVLLARGAPGVRPLFFAPGLTGRAVDFVHLVAALSSDLPVYALELHAFADAGHQDETLRDAVKAVVDVMQRVQPRGPYAVAGFSAGGTFAIAIAEELSARGELTDFVGLIDCVPPASVRVESPLGSPRRMLRLSKTVVGRVQEILEQPDPARLLWSRTRAAARRSLARWHGPLLRHKPTIEELFGELPSFSKREVESMQRYLDAVVSHCFGEVDCDVVLFRTPLDPPEGPYEPDLGWGRVTRGKVTVELVRGRHNDLMRAAGCRELAARLQVYLSSLARAHDAA